MIQRLIVLVIVLAASGLACDSGSLTGFDSDEVPRADSTDTQVLRDALIITTSAPFTGERTVILDSRGTLHHIRTDPHPTVRGEITGEQHEQAVAMFDSLRFVPALIGIRCSDTRLHRIRLRRTNGSRLERTFFECPPEYESSVFDATIAALRNIDSLATWVERNYAPWRDLRLQSDIVSTDIAYGDSLKIRLTIANPAGDTRELYFLYDSILNVNAVLEDGSARLEWGNTRCWSNSNECTPTSVTIPPGSSTVLIASYPVSQLLNSVPTTPRVVNITYRPRAVCCGHQPRGTTVTIRP